MTDLPPAPNPLESQRFGDLPERLIKQTVRYIDHRSVDRDALTPMMRHYADLKDEYPQALLLYRVGDFFETFFQDAITIAQELELVLTGKDAGKTVGRVPLAGVPHHAIERYCAQLVERGYAVAICDQTEDAADAQGRLVQRQVTRVITPGTVLEEGMLNARRNNYLAAVVIAGAHWGLAIADVSTGEFLTTQTSGLEMLTQEILRLQPSEILLPTNAPDLVGLLRPDARAGTPDPRRAAALPEALPPQFCYTLRPQAPFQAAEARQRLLERFRVRSLEGMGCEHLPLAVRAAGGLLQYLEETSERQLEAVPAEANAAPSPAPPAAHAYPTRIPLQPLCTYTLSDFLVIDHQTRRNLEITQTQRDGTFHGSLLWALDRTVTAMGGRALRRWLLQPLLDRSAIQARQDTIQELIDQGTLRQQLQQILKQIYDLERLTGRAGSGTANARDLVALADSLGKLPEIAELAAVGRSPFLTALQTVPPVMDTLGRTLRAHLVETPPLYLTEGNLIRPGVNPQLDHLRQSIEADQQWIAQLETSERQRTGIATLKVGYTKAFGYYLSISRAKASADLPDDYIRKQTLTHEERYITPELKQRESAIFLTREAVHKLEYEIFTALRLQVAEQSEPIRQVAGAIAALDALCSLAEVAVYQNYCRPAITESRRIEIVDGRHPVVEQSLPAGFFVPNSASLGSGDQAMEHGGIGASIAPPPPRPPADVPAPPPAPTPTHSAPDLIILTGPNASGKSCYLRQVGLIQLMAQVGSFVPAAAATLGVCDRIFTRVGAVDDLATGQSTFMVEMNETANILNHATPRSLVLLDEIGRGTATFDGLSIAWAVAEHLATEIRARTLFATHYHELNELASLLSNVANYQVVVKELPDQIIFLHQVRPGGADKSYGIEAGRLAGLPTSVIERARQVMGQIERHSHIAVGLRGELRDAPRSPDSTDQGPTKAASRRSRLREPAGQLNIFT
ncbi:DNA mismatch repair protein MutS [Thermoleptolyngbya sp. C42_A2020_037]|uniref:DNA mismatch repair protein MutS n=1 Tax=Thermoleptolyngbya sp. C42_A2020_037 TaxID=2747799 RepID=UPI0019FF30DE|nr:DNA mismatch repair protein MutS [Thermoleptolyngbya sp. C42_A2020_037]MBF2083317.1 DNA mismatch repair protein MutS [Thermoleptolyngbya sp. C42_A2020_037]